MTEQTLEQLNQDAEHVIAALGEHVGYVDTIALVQVNVGDIEVFLDTYQVDTFIEEIKDLGPSPRLDQVIQVVQSYE